ncbi:MAG: hypothetical protein IBJ09_02545 [Bacteroidia bacterium]|nr:hypothetical protein [Bacteroidia bacterium]
MPYTIQTTEHTNDQITATFTLREDDPVFSGHFPGQPVLPGVLQMRLVADVISRCLHKKAVLKEAAAIKFLAPVVPGIYHSFSVQVHYTLDGAMLKADAQIRSGTVTFLKMKSVFSLD